jgi:hypothetical protein
VGLSPAQLLFHRNIRDGIPVDPASLQPNKLWIIAAKKREEEFAKRNKSLISRYNQSTKELPALEIGANVSIQDTDRDGRWSRFGVIVDRCDRKYFIRVHGSGRVISRNRRFIKPVLFHDDYDNIQSTDDSCPVDDNMNQFDTSSEHLHNRNGSGSTNLQTPSTSQSDGESCSQDTSVESTPPVLLDSSVHQEVPSRVSPSTNSQPSNPAMPIPRMLKRLLPFNNPGLNE